MLKDLVSVYQERWAHQDPSTEEDHITSAYERDLCLSMSSAGFYRLYMAYADQKPIAGILAYYHHGRCFVERFAHSPEFRKYSVGTVLLAKTIEDGIAQGWRELDLMRGAEAYKYRWSGVSEPTTNIIFARGALMGRVAGMIDRLFLFATRSALKRLLRPRRNPGKRLQRSAGTTAGESGGTAA
jgi:CelD/BcsL family acetyltransferase involved in cellulose biosynthesis